MGGDSSKPTIEVYNPDTTQFYGYQNNNDDDKTHLGQTMYHFLKTEKKYTNNDLEQIGLEGLSKLMEKSKCTGIRLFNMDLMEHPDTSEKISSTSCLQYITYLELNNLPMKTGWKMSDYLSKNLTKLKISLNSEMDLDKNFWQTLMSIDLKHLEITRWKFSLPKMDTTYMDKVFEKVEYLKLSEPVIHNIFGYCDNKEQKRKLFKIIYSKFDKEYHKVNIESYKNLEDSVDIQTYVNMIKQFKSLTFDKMENSFTYNYGEKKKELKDETFKEILDECNKQNIIFEQFYLKESIKYPEKMFKVKNLHFYSNDGKFKNNEEQLNIIKTMIDNDKVTEKLSSGFSAIKEKDFKTLTIPDHIDTSCVSFKSVKDEN